MVNTKYEKKKMGNKTKNKNKKTQNINLEIFIYQ